MKHRSKGLVNKERSRGTGKCRLSFREILVAQCDWIVLWDGHLTQTQEHDAIDEDAHRQGQERQGTLR